MASEQPGSDLESIINNNPDLKRVFDYATTSPEAVKFYTEVAAAKKRTSSPIYKTRRFIEDHPVEIGMGILGGALIVYTLWPK